MTKNQYSTASQGITDIEKIRFGQKQSTKYVNNKYPNKSPLTSNTEMTARKKTLFNIETSSQVQI